jgi:hypothetical protein
LVGGDAVLDGNLDSLSEGAVSKSKTYFQELCYGCNVDLIAEWCGVDIKTARHFKAGTRRPGRQAQELFLLHRDGRILPAEWEGFSFRGGRLFDPYGKELTHGILRAYPIALQLLRALARGNASATRDIDALLHSMTTALPFGPRAAATSVASAATAAEAKPSALVRYRAPETIRRRNSLRSRVSRAAAPSQTGSAKVDGGNSGGTGNARRDGGDFAALSPHLRLIARREAER